MKKLFPLLMLCITSACYSAFNEGKKSINNNNNSFSTLQEKKTDDKEPQSNMDWAMPDSSSNSKSSNQNNIPSSSSKLASVADLGQQITMPERNVLIARLNLVGAINPKITDKFVESLAGKTFYPIGVANVVESVFVDAVITAACGVEKMIKTKKAVGDFMKIYKSSNQKKFVTPSILLSILQDQPDAIENLIKIGYLKQ